MHDVLIEKIYTSYNKNDWFFYDSDLCKHTHSFSSEFFDEFNFPYVASSIFDNIFSWHDNEDIFDHFFPSVLINCIENDFSENEVTLCLMEKLEPSFFNFGDCKYFYEISYFNLEQRNIFHEFITRFKNKNALHDIECEKVEKTLNWLKRRDDLIEEIRCVFDTEERLPYHDIADPFDIDGKYLCEKLNGLNWQDVNKDLLSSIIEDYYYLYDKAFFFFIPSCLINTLINLFDVSLTIPYYTIGYLSQNINDNLNKKKYSFFLPKHKVIVAKFFSLILELGSCEKFRKKDIEISLESMWLKKDIS